MPKALTQEQRQTIKGILLTQVRPQFATLGDRWQSSAAAQIGVNQSTISRLLQEEPAGGSVDFAEKLGVFLNMTTQEVLFGEPQPGEVPRLRDLPGFAEAIGGAKRRALEESRSLDDLSLERAGNFRCSPVPSVVTAGLLLELAATTRNK